MVIVILDFFQNGAKARRNEKLIFKLKDDCGVRTDDHRAIADKFMSDYSLRFKSGHASIRNLNELQLPNLISSTNNAYLI